MKVSTMRAIDRYTGIPLCASLKAHEKLTRRLDAPDKINRILVVKFWGMGGLILAAPAIKTLRRAFPDAEIHLATLQSSRGTAELLNLADHCHYLDVSGPAFLVPYKITAYLNRIKKIDAHAVIDLEYLTRISAAVSYISGAPLRAGFQSPAVWRGNIHNLPEFYSAERHVTDNFLSLVKLLPGEFEPVTEFRIKVEDSAMKEARKALLEKGVKDTGRIIAFNTNAGSMALERMWPPDYFVELINRVIEAGIGTPVLTGSAEEMQRVETIRRNLSKPEMAFNLAGRLSLNGLAGLLLLSRLLVTNDSGPLHLATAIGVPTISFFGPETPVLYGPKGDDHTVFYKGIDCSPCIDINKAKTVKCVKPRPECLYQISVDEVFEAVKSRIRA